MHGRKFIHEISCRGSRPCGGCLTYFNVWQVRTDSKPRRRLSKVRMNRPPPPPPGPLGLCWMRTEGDLVSLSRRRISQKNIGYVQDSTQHQYCYGGHSAVVWCLCAASSEQHQTPPGRWALPLGCVNWCKTVSYVCHIGWEHLLRN